MRIVHQSALPSHCHFPVAPLMLVAPKIAGLLPAHTGSQPCSPSFIFKSTGLAELSNPQHMHLFEAAEMLLEIAVEFMRGTFNEDALRAAETVFHRAVGGQSIVRPLSPQQFNAELDADWFDLLAQAKRTQPLTPTQADTIVLQAQTARKGGAA